MAAKTTALSLVLIVSLLLCTAETTASYVNPRTIPSCREEYVPFKCLQNYTTAYGAKAAAESGALDITITGAFKGVFAARFDCIRAHSFLRAKLKKGDDHPNVAVTCMRDFELAIQYLGEIETTPVARRMEKMSKSAAIQIQKKVQIAYQSARTCTSNSKTPSIYIKPATDAVKSCNDALTFWKELAAYL